MLAPADARAFAATAFDGAIDFGGTSGASFFGIGEMLPRRASTNPPVDPGWIGAGFLPLLGTAAANSTGTGSGNLVTIFRTDAALDFESRTTTSGDKSPSPLSCSSWAWGWWERPIARGGRS